MAMNDLIRTAVYTGFGALALARKKAEEFVEELIQNKELTRDEGQRVVQELISLAEDGRDGLEKRWFGLVDGLLLRFNLPGRLELEAQWADLAEKIRSGRFPLAPGKEKSAPPATR